MVRKDIIEAVVYEGEAIKSGVFNDQPMMWMLCHDALHDETQLQITPDTDHTCT